MEDELAGEMKAGLKDGGVSKRAKIGVNGRYVVGVWYQFYYCCSYGRMG